MKPAQTIHVLLAALLLMSLLLLAYLRPPRPEIVTTSPATTHPIMISGRVRIEAQAINRLQQRLATAPMDSFSRTRQFLADFVSADGGVCDVQIRLVVPKPANESVSIQSIPQSQPPPPLDVTVDPKGNWSPRIIFLEPGQQIRLHNECEGAYWSGFDRRHGATFARDYRPGTTMLLGPFREDEYVYRIQDDIQVPSNRRNRNAYIYVVRDKSSNVVTNPSGDFSLPLEPHQSAETIRLRWIHEMLGHVNHVRVNGVSRTLEQGILGFAMTDPAIQQPLEIVLEEAALSDLER